MPGGENGRKSINLTPPFAANEVITRTSQKDDPDNGYPPAQRNAISQPVCAVIGFATQMA
jgi:hypothetical protein